MSGGKCPTPQQPYVFNTYTRYRSKRVAFTRDDLSFPTIVQELHNVLDYNAVEGLSALCVAVLVVEDVDQFSRVLKIDVGVQWTVADVLTTPIVV